ncbi:ABC transporter ATP-binding protein [Prauserella marina]|uniref:Branched-chain amino acid transport system ATP-binding protein n=1 Tax=Prauserella marina TaxID=530584 RepID=A0A222VV02_9PSEU|nr:ABC transporter ATP-binding protein [Prauserella marina]ASR37748.1 ABC transporter ATP-binding protein [Prauserella marina]PWV75695.1 amino acid/amide ABC transporter ATP-binding protein 1 (HAAT family) [Prauserella marina]SDD28535.1 branched-chain amino acid transport system ATP-binding protein [Prauserella marina]
MPADLSSISPEPGVAKPDPLLVVDGLRRSFGGLLAVHVEHLEIQRGAITALIGPNGAGKSTLFNVISGFDKPTEGRWSFAGKPVTGMAAHRIARGGLVRTFQLTRTLSRMTVLDNMRLAAPDQRGERLPFALLPPLWLAGERAITARADELLDRFRLSHLRDEYAGTLSGGQRKLLEMARALLTDPVMVLLDEPMSGVNPALAESLLEHLTGLRDEGMTVCFVEHDMDVVMGVSDWVVCMADGAVVAEGPPHTVAQNPAVIDAYLGARRGAPIAHETDEEPS